MTLKRVLLLAPVALATFASAAAINPAGGTTDIAEPVDQSSALAVYDSNLPEEWQNSEDLSPSLVFRSPTATEDGSLIIHEDVGLGSLIGTIANRMIYYTAGKASKYVIKMVLTKILKTKTPEKHQTTISYVEKALEQITVVVLTKAIGKVPKVGKKLNMNLGADAGDHPKVRRGLLDAGAQPLDVVSWDLSDAHSAGNTFNRRSIVSDALRARMVDEGASNVTFLHTDAAPLLAYTRDDSSVHVHWRQADENDDKKADDVFNKHYPFFEGDGAGFKLSAIVNVDPKATQFSQKDAEEAAK